tara:strand:- start:102 stop:1124 length:1023 start_codon:yes stop_codon:yes gene_type:complete
MIVDYYGFTSPWLRWIFDETTIPPNKKVGVIDHWNMTYYNEQELRKFLEDKDISFLLIEETLEHRYGDDKKIIDVCKEYNTYYICFSENKNIQIPSSNVITMPWFFKSPLYVTENFQPDFDYREKPYDFNLLLGSRKPYRDLIYKSLRHNSKVYSTYFGHPDYVADNIIDDQDITQALISQDVSKQKLNTLVQLDRGNSKDTPNFGVSHIIPKKIYDVSHFDIVSETTYDQWMTTEKTAKPLSTGRFFCCFSHYRTLTYLEKFGFCFHDFPWFGDLCDETLDRFSLVVNFIDEVSQEPLLVRDIYEKTRENRKHNFYNYHEKIGYFTETISNWVERCLKA